MNFTIFYNAILVVVLVYGFVGPKDIPCSWDLDSNADEEESAQNKVGKL